jgi:hypothetical protein
MIHSSHLGKHPQTTCRRGLISKTPAFRRGRKALVLTKQQKKDMADHLTNLPPELRNRIYEYVLT